MFGRRRHVAPAVVAPAPQLSEERIFDVVHAQIAAAIGEHGEWTLSRRTEADTDDIFYGVIAHSVATHVMEALRVAREELTDPAASTSAVSTGDGEHVAQRTAKVEHAVIEREARDSEDVDEPAAFGWQPAPITVWTDLKKPVTGPVPSIRDHELVA